jgi:hypothetical protein
VPLPQSFCHQSMGTHSRLRPMAGPTSRMQRVVTVASSLAHPAPQSNQVELVFTGRLFSREAYPYERVRAKGARPPSLTTLTVAPMPPVAWDHHRDEGVGRGDDAKEDVHGGGPWGLRGVPSLSVAVAASLTLSDECTVPCRKASHASPLRNSMQGLHRAGQQAAPPSPLAPPL